MVVAVADRDRVDVVDLDAVDRTALVDWLTDLYRDCKLVVHNAAFDLAFLHQQFGVGYPAHPVWDTMLAEQLINAGYGESAKLEDVLYRYFEIVMDKTLQTSFDGQELSDDQLAYAAEDVRHLIPLAEAQRTKLKELGLGRIWWIERNAVNVFAEMWRRGVFVDLERLNPLIETAQAERGDLEQQLVSLLTPYIYDLRVAKYDEEMEARRDYREREAKAEAEYARQWQAKFDRDYPFGFKDHPEWNDIATYDDGRVKGQTRYVKDHMKLWREVNKLPKKPKLDDSPINLKSPKQVLFALQNYGLDIKDTKAETLEALTYTATPTQRDELVKPFLDYRGVTKMIQDAEILVGLLDEHSRSHGNWRQLGTATGRPSCARPNMLNIPKRPEYRACFRASPGNVFIVADYSQMELRLVAEMSKDPNLTHAFRENLDIHSLTAAGIYHNSNDPASAIHLVDEDKERPVGKKVNFSVLYGMGPATMVAGLAAEGFPITFPQAKKALDGWRGTYRLAAEFIEEQGELANLRLYTTTPLGRRRNFYPPSGDDEKAQRAGIARAGANHPIQGANADITKLAMTLIQPQVFPLGGSVVLQVYDEIVVEIPVEHAEEAYAIVVGSMTAAAEEVLKTVPAAVDAVVSPSWSEKEAIWP